jgi:CheY-like chemotaxis protein
VVFPSSDDLLPFLTQRIAPLAGIRATQTSHILGVGKQLNHWQLAELPEAGRSAGPGPTILLVDDDADFAIAARTVLEAAGYTVVVASSSREAAERLREARPALVLLDLMMETPLAGLDVARAVQAEHRLRGVPVLAISAIRSTGWAEALPPVDELPLDDFVDKPIEPDRLLEKVRRFIG